MIDANYMLFPEGLDAVFDAMTDLDPDDVRVVQVAGADAAKIVVDFDDRQLFVSGFVQNGDLIQTVDVVDPQPYDAQPDGARRAVDPGQVRPGGPVVVRPVDQ